MHAAVFNAPIRSSVLGSRFKTSSLTPFIFPVTSSSAATLFPTIDRHCDIKPQRSQQKRLASTTAPCCNRITSQPAAAELQSTVLKATATRQRQRQSTPVASARFMRRASTQASPTARSSNPTSSSSPSPSLPQEGTVLDWNTFFKLRASRRRYTLVSSILSSLTTTAAGVQVLGMQNLDSLGTQVMGLDPFVVLGLATVACGAVGWLAGPFLGNAFWGALHRKYKGGVAKKEKEFFDRIKRFRVDPSSNSFANPVPDYYGEKIGSVRDYRQWLKDQRAYNRKKRSFV